MRATKQKRYQIRKAPKAAKLCRINEVGEILSSCSVLALCLRNLHLVLIRAKIMANLGQIPSHLLHLSYPKVNNVQDNNTFFTSKLRICLYCSTYIKHW